MDNNELLAKVLAQLEESNSINKQLIQILAVTKAENQQLKEINNKVEPLEVIITPVQEDILRENIQNKDVIINAKENIKNFRKNENFERKEPIFEESTTILNAKEKNDIEPIFFESVIKENEEVIVPLTINTEKKDKIGKFKEMIASHLVSFTNKFGFIKENDYSLKNVGHKIEVKVKGVVPEVSPIYQTMKHNFTQLAQDVNVAVTSHITDVNNNIKEQINQKINQFTDRFFLIGKSSKVRKMKRDFSNALKAVGFEAEELFTLNQKNDFYSIEEVNVKVNEDLNLKAKIQKINNTYVIPMLDNIDDNLKAEFLQRAIWPKLTKNLEEITGLSLLLNKAKDSNKYLNILNDFANKNNLTTEIVIHSLKNNPDILKDHKGINILMKNKDEVLISEQKYEVLARNIFIVLQSLVKVGSHLQTTVQNLKIEPSQKEEILNDFSNTKIAQEDDKKYTFDIIRKNVGKLLANKEYITSIVESNKMQKLEKKEVVEIINEEEKPFDRFKMKR